jgi:elongation factor P hydroxylase
MFLEQNDLGFWQRPNGHDAQDDDDDDDDEMFLGQSLTINLL